MFILIYYKFIQISEIRLIFVAGDAIPTDIDMTQNCSDISI